MKLLLFCSCLLAIPLQAVYASTFSNGKSASLRMSRPVVKTVNGKLLKGRKPQSKHDKANVVPKKSRPKLLIEFLLRELVEIVIGYFKDDTYPFIVSTHRWVLEEEDTPEIAVDSARVYMVTESDGLIGLNHSSVSLDDGECCCMEFGDPEWHGYYRFCSSHDGRYISFCHGHKASTDHREHIKVDSKWLMQSNELEGEGFKPVAFGDEDLHFGRLSRDGQTLFAYDKRLEVTYVYRIKEKAGKDPTASMKFVLNGNTRAVSGNANRVMITNTDRLEIHDIGNGASNLIYGIDVDAPRYCVWNEDGVVIGEFSRNNSCLCALNEDGSEAAFVPPDSDELWILNVDKAVVVKIPKKLGRIERLVYSDENKLHALHYGSCVSLFDPLRRTLIPIETHSRLDSIGLAISPDANYIVILQRSKYSGKKAKKNAGKRLNITTVKRKLGTADWKNLFGYETEKAKASAVPTEKALTQTRNALPQSASRIRSTTMSVEGGSLSTLDGNLRYRYILDGDWVIHRMAVCNSNDRGSVKLPASLVKGVPQHLQTNSDGTVFYVAAIRDKKRYIYVIDVASKRVYKYRLKHIESDIVEMKAHVDGKVLEVITQDKVVLVFSCSKQRLRLRNKLVEGERVVGVSQSIAVFEKKDKAAGPTIGYFDLTKAGDDLYSLPYRKAGFVAVDKDDIYLTNTKSTLRFNVKTKRITVIKRH